jgi:hypothetical protein
MEVINLLLNLRFSGASSGGVDSNMGLSGEYYVNLPNEVGGGIVNEFNVRGYLGSPKNEQITSSFYNYLTGNTSFIEFKEIFYSDRKLSELFNDFYNTTVLSGTPSSLGYIENQLEGTSADTYSKNIHDWNGVASYKQMSGSTLEITGDTFDTSSVEYLETFKELYPETFSLSTTQYLNTLSDDDFNTVLSGTPILPGQEPNYITNQPGGNGVLPITIQGSQNVVGRQTNEAYFIDLVLFRTYKNNTRYNFKACEDVISTIDINSIGAGDGPIPPIRDNDEITSEISDLVDSFFEDGGQPPTDSTEISLETEGSETGAPSDAVDDNSSDTPSETIGDTPISDDSSPTDTGGSLGDPITDPAVPDSPTIGPVVPVRPVRPVRPIKEILLKDGKPYSINNTSSDTTQKDETSSDSVIRIRF